jgi:isopentenyl diphosphate isomerase/L-lactate dehydrogenase-like FMN-dependent dehydrogenase
MMNETTVASNRRQFLKFLACSPLIAAPRALWWQKEFLGGGDHDTSADGVYGPQGYLIKSADEALDVFDFEEKARDVLNPGHFAYIATGSDDDATLIANREGFSKFVWHPRRLVDVSNIDPSVELWGQRYGSPIFLAPTSSNRLCHPEGELAAAKACIPHDNTVCLSTLSTATIEDVTEARGAPIWFQLYASGSLSISRKLIQRAEAAGAPVIAMTVDQLPGRNRVTDKRLQRLIPGFTGVREDSPACNSCHTPGRDRNTNRRMVLDATAGEARGDDSRLTWDFVRQLRDIVKGKFILKGIITPEDAELSVQYGLDGVYVSNHGGRSAATGYSTIEALPAITKAVAGRVPIVIDSGIRRGTDVFKALALGASAVLVGRPYMWGLSSFGQPGVEKVLDILQREYELVMAQAGATSVPEIAAGHYVTRR